MNAETLLEEILLLPPEQQSQLFMLAAARPALRQAMERGLRVQPVEVGVAERGTEKPLAPSTADYRIIFDGGSKGNPGEGYGSYEITALRTGKARTERLTFGNNVTNNEAEYETLVGALQTLAERIEAAGKSPTHYTLDIRGDSMLVIQQVNGKWKAKDARMAQYRDTVRQLLQKYKSYTLRHHDRSNSVAALGH